MAAVTVLRCALAPAHPPCPHRLRDLAGIHNAVGVEALSNLSHEANVERIFIAIKILALQLPDTVFCADAATITRDLVEHFGGQAFPMLREEAARVKVVAA